MSDSIENEDGTMFLDVDDADHFRWLRDEECPRLHKIVDAAIEWLRSGQWIDETAALRKAVAIEIQRRRESDIPLGDFGGPVNGPA